MARLVRVTLAMFSKWKTFANRAGWSIKYPRDWRVSSCMECPDPTDPDVFVSFYNPSTKGLIMIEHLIDKPADQASSNG